MADTIERIKKPLLSMNSLKKCPITNWLNRPIMKTMSIQGQSVANAPVKRVGVLVTGVLMCDASPLPKMPISGGNNPPKQQQREAEQ